MPPRRFAIAGGGVAGLTAAIALRRAGCEAEVYDRDPSEPGGVLILWANALRALRSLDGAVCARVLEKATPLAEVAFETAQGTTLWELPVRALAERHGASVYVRRTDLVACLRAAAGPATVAEVEGFEASDREVRPRLRAGTAPAFDGLIGADGVRSRVREALLGPEDPRSAYHAGWCGVAACPPDHWPLGPGRTVAMVGRGLRFCAGTLRADPEDGARHVYWYATEKVGARSVAELADLFRGWRRPVAELVSATPDAHRYDIVDRAPARCWGQGRVTLLGDAAQPMTPDLGQGACLAIEGAVSLGRALARSSDVVTALRDYEGRRSGRHERVAWMSRATAFQSMIDTPGAAALRDLAIRRVLPSVAGTELDWLLGHDVS